MVVKQTIEAGTVLGCLYNEHLPGEVKEKVKLIKRSRAVRAIAGTFTGVLLIAGLHSFLSKSMSAKEKAALALPLFGFGIKTTKDTWNISADVRRLTGELGQGILKHRKNFEVANFLRRGATHVLVDGHGNVHFVQAPKKLEGKAFRPVIGRMRAPLRE